MHDLLATKGPTTKTASYLADVVGAYFGVGVLLILGNAVALTKLDDPLVVYAALFLLGSTTTAVEFSPPSPPWDDQA